MRPCVMHSARRSEMSERSCSSASSHELRVRRSGGGGFVRSSIQQLAHMQDRDGCGMALPLGRADSMAADSRQHGSKAAVGSRQHGSKVTVGSMAARQQWWYLRWGGLAVVLRTQRGGTASPLLSWLARQRQAPARRSPDGPPRPGPSTAGRAAAAEGVGVAEGVGMGAAAEYERHENEK